jgi:hypothetical protein
MGKRNILLAILLFQLYSLSGQEYSLGDSVNIRFFNFHREVRDSNDLTLRISFTNISKRPIKVYKELIEGYGHDRFGNVDITMQKKNDGKYSYHPLHSYGVNMSYETDSTLRHFDPTKEDLATKATDTLEINLIALANGFRRGYYRFKINLRVATILNNAEYHYDPLRSVFPPPDTLKYIPSRWIYFHVSKQILKPSLMNRRKE